MDLQHLFYVTVATHSEFIPDGLYSFEAVHSLKFLTYSPERSTIVQQAPSSTDNESQYFYIQHIGYNDYIIREYRTGYVFSVQHGSLHQNAPIILNRFTDKNTLYQIFNFELANPTTNEYFIFVKHTRMVLDIEGENQNSFAKLTQNSQHKKANQRFILHRINRPSSKVRTPNISINSMNIST
ncbi:unnamed protein product [Didymodactylos carnosus]|uniref:Ricin B lectin domain-containing protein n=1 Tax=Didymodactylos carnosus TaxID=1234261 RepID=A0A813VPF9_9BILA|nr:unnamed protein product [Didymodactylos carnosus]CAF0848847.1 unnamed protein product [Didymodactylos carnosus]CAF3497374.1 unnamed protein product [Didymodactylos carnosus]CAF3636525.1 unnamed protein product [Didymodactylos carnosus]